MSEDNDTEIDSGLVDKEVITYLKIIGYVTLLFTTGVIGFGLLSKAGLRQDRIETMKNVATLVLLIIWTIFLASEIIEIKRLNK